MTENNMTPKTKTEKDLIKFRNQFHNLLKKYPEITITGDIHGHLLAYIVEGEWYKHFPKVYLPKRAEQELVEH